MRNRELQVEIEGDELVIRIGIYELARRSCLSPYFDQIVVANNCDESTVRIVDQDFFAESMRQALVDEVEEDGTTLLHKLIDAAVTRVVEQGYVGIEIKGTMDKENTTVTAWSGVPADDTFSDTDA